MNDKEIYKMGLMEVLDFAREKALQEGKHDYLKRIHAISRFIDRQEVTRGWVQDTAQWMTGTPDTSVKSMTFLLESILKKLGKKVEEG